MCQRGVRPADSSQAKQNGLHHDAPGNCRGTLIARDHPEVNNLEPGKALADNGDGLYFYVETRLGQSVDLDERVCRVFLAKEAVKYLLLLCGVRLPVGDTGDEGGNLDNIGGSSSFGGHHAGNSVQGHAQLFHQRLPLGVGPSGGAAGNEQHIASENRPAIGRARRGNVWIFTPNFFHAKPGTLAPSGLMVLEIR